MENNKNLTEGNILRSLVTFALPVLFALFLQALYGGIDLLIVGRYAATGDVSGVSTGSMLLQMVTGVITGLAMGVTVLVGQSIGEKNAQKAGRAVGSGVFLFLVLGMILSVAIVLGAGLLAQMMHAPADAFAQTVSYVRICGAGFLFVVAYNVLGSIFRGLGDSRTPLITVAIACMVNVCGDLLFVRGFRMGASGAALATILAQAVSVVASFLIIQKKGLPFTFSIHQVRFDGEIIGRELRLGIPIALQELLVGISFLVIQAIVNAMGVVASAGVGIAEKLCVFLMLVPSAYMQSMSAFVAQNTGAGHAERSRRALWYGILSSLLVGIVMSYITIFHGGALASVFSGESEVIMAAADYLKAYGIDCILVSILFCFIGYYNGCGNTFFVMSQGLIGAFCVRIPFVYAMSRREGATLFSIGLGTPAASVVQILLCLGMFWLVKKKEAKYYSEKEKSMI